MFQSVFVLTNPLPPQQCAYGHYRVERQINFLSLVFDKTVTNSFEEPHDRGMPSIKHKFPTPRREKQAQTITLPPLCFTVGTVHLG